MTPEQVQAIADLRVRNLAPKQIARQLGLRPAEVSAVIKAQAEQVAATRTASGEPDPIYQCLVNKGCLPGLMPKRANPFSALTRRGDASEVSGNGFAVVLLARQTSYNRLTVCTYLIDIWCLGVKDAMPPRKLDQMQYKDFVEHVYDRFPEGAEEISLELAQAIVLGGEAYAAKLGFQPHRDFEKARSHLGNWSGEPTLTFGYKGKPHYMSGPYDTPSKVLDTLRQSVGEGNFHFTLMG